MSQYPFFCWILFPGQVELFILLLTLNFFLLSFCWKRKNGLMDHEDFRACLISMGYDLVRQKFKFYYYDILLSLFRFVF